MISYKNTISGGSSIMQLIRIPENTRNVILIVMNLNGCLGGIRFCVCIMATSFWRGFEDRSGLSGLLCRGWSHLSGNAIGGRRSGCSPVASLKTARGHRPQARGHIIYTPKKVVTKSPSQPITARGSGERCKLPQRGLGRSPSRYRFWCILD